MHIRVIAALIMVPVACGSSRQVDLQLDKSKPASELTQSEVREVCRQSLDALKSLYGASVCSAQGLIDQHTKGASCATARDSCMDTIFDLSKCDAGEVKAVHCDVTVGALERCINDTLAKVEELPAFSCASSIEELERLSRGDFNITLAVSCDVVKEQCGELRLGVDLSGDDGATPQ